MRLQGCPSDAISDASQCVLTVRTKSSLPRSLQGLQLLCNKHSHTLTHTHTRARAHLAARPAEHSYAVPHRPHPPLIRRLRDEPPRADAAPQPPQPRPPDQLLRHPICLTHLTGKAAHTLLVLHSVCVPCTVFSSTPSLPMCKVLTRHMYIPDM